MKRLNLLLFLVLYTLCTYAQVRTEYLFEKGWKFIREDGQDFMKSEYDDARWQLVTVPHSTGWTGSRPGTCRTYGRTSFCWSRLVSPMV